MFELLARCKPWPLAEQAIMCTSVRDTGLQSKALGTLRQLAASLMPPPPKTLQSDEEEGPSHGCGVHGCPSGLAVLTLSSCLSVMKLVTAHLLALWSLALPLPPTF